MWDLVGNPEDRCSIQVMKIFPACFVLVMGMITLGEPPSEPKLSDAQPGAELHAGVVHEMNADDSGRETRAITGTAKGLAAAQKLLAGAEKVKTTSKNFRKYLKAGNYETALADFNSVEPVVMKANRSFNFGHPRSQNPPTVRACGRYATYPVAEWRPLQQRFACVRNQVSLRCNV